jgi:hypothetical protein
MVNETLEIVGEAVQEGDIFAMLGGLISNPLVIMLIGVTIGIIIVVIFYMFVWKKDDANVFEYEKFEDTVIENLDKTFNTEGMKSNARIIHGINNPIGRVEKWLNHKGQWNILEYDDVKKEYVQKENVVKTSDGKTKTINATEEYNLYIFKVKAEGWFEKAKYILTDKDHVSYNSQNNTWVLRDDISLKLFGKCWITSPLGEQYLQDISFRRSLENNMTFLQNQSRKVIFLETAFAQKHELILGKGMAKRLQYDQYGKDVLKKAGEIDDEDET